MQINSFYIYPAPARSGSYKPLFTINRPIENLIGQLWPCTCHYEILAPLGAGRMDEVYRAKDGADGSKGESVTAAQPASTNKVSAVSVFQKDGEI
jgi:hypothetical protein